MFHGMKVDFQRNNDLILLMWTQPYSKSNNNYTVRPRKKETHKSS